MAFVLDASMTMAWCFRDERTAESEAIGRALAQTDEAVVPTIWSVEVCNAALSGLRHNRLTMSEGVSFLRLLDRLPISQINSTTPETIRHLLDLARTHDLSAHDASFLDLALNLGLPLATLDARLGAAADRAGVPPFLPRAEQKRQDHDIRRGLGTIPKL